MSKKMTTAEERLYAYGLYTTMIAGIKHFDNLQTSYRVMTSRLLLATFAAIGFILSLEIKDLPIDQLLTVIIISLISLGSITTLWNLDLTFVERLSISLFAETLRLEKKYSWLPQVHHNMLGEGSHAASPSKKVLFYIGSSFIILLTMTLAAVFYAKTFNDWAWIPVLVGMAIVVCIYIAILKKRSLSFEELIGFLEDKKHGN